MDPYDPNAICPKCHSTDIAAKHHGYLSREWRWISTSLSADLDTIPDWIKDQPAYIERTCRWCRYVWLEEPLDVVREIDVRSEVE